LILGTHPAAAAAAANPAAPADLRIAVSPLQA